MNFNRKAIFMIVNAARQAIAWPGSPVKHGNLKIKVKTPMSTVIQFPCTYQLNTNSCTYNSIDTNDSSSPYITLRCILVTDLQHSSLTPTHEKLQICNLCQQWVNNAL